MSKDNDFYRQIEDADRQRRKQERKEKWAKREKGFWKAFLFTEDGKPKSGFMVYTFCLSMVFLAVYIGGYYLAIELLAEPVAGLPVFWGNLLQSLAASVFGLLLALALHLLLPDKRLMLGTHLWLALYVAAAVITLAVMLRGTGAIGAMLTFFAWFAGLPLVLGLTVTYLLYRRSRGRGRGDGGQEDWKKYIRRR